MKMNKNIQWKESCIDYDKLNELTAQKISASEWSKNNLTGYKHSDESKSKFSKAKIGYKRSKNSVEKSIKGTKQTKWLQLLEKYPLQCILDAQTNNGNHQSNTCKELGISHTAYKKLCNHYNIEIKKSNYEKGEFSKVKQSKSILVWKCSKKEPYKKIGKPKEYYSVRFCCNSFEPILHKGNMLRNMKNGTPYRDMFFEYKN
jgi:hypothetical protein